MKSRNYLICCYRKLSLVLILGIQVTHSMSLIKTQPSYFMDGGVEADPVEDIAEVIVAKGYLPKQENLPSTSVVKQADGDVTYLLSKLSDEELLMLLNDSPKKKVFELNDIIKTAVYQQPQQIKVTNIDHSTTPHYNFLMDSDNYKGRFKIVNEKGVENQQGAFFRLNDRSVNHNTKNGEDLNYLAMQKINNLLHSRPLQSSQDSEDIENEKKELLFDALVNQLKTLCCKKRTSSKPKHQTLYAKNDMLYEPERKQPNKLDVGSAEYMFLIINDEIKGNGSDDLISVDPESLDKNSSVVLLGPISSPLSNTQLKVVMNRLYTELSRPEYVPLLQQISKGALTNSNIRVMNSLITGPETRRYIKPHRCNHQSPLARVYGGPKWLICTGYLNLNTPSIYDRK